jgi:hypothetical protein
VSDPFSNTAEEFDTLENALSFAEELIEDHLDSDGWNEEVENITISKIVYRAEKSKVMEKKDFTIWDDSTARWSNSEGELWPEVDDGFDLYVEYTMKECTDG